MKIVACAIRFNGLTISLPQPARHADIIKALSDVNRKITVKPSDQGFLDSEGYFCGRVLAYGIAVGSGQIHFEDYKEGKELFSEDLW